MSVRPTLPPRADGQVDVDVDVLGVELDPFEPAESLLEVDEDDDDDDDDSLDEPAPSDDDEDDDAAVRDDEPRLSVL